MRNRKGLYRLGAMALIVLVAIAMFIVGRGHTVFFDNKTLEHEGQSYSAYQRAVVMVNGTEVAKLDKRDRGMATHIGQNFKMELILTQNKGDEPVTVPVQLKLPYSMDGIVLNLPALVAGLPQEVWQKEFIVQEPAAPAEDELPPGEDEMLPTDI